jgi:tRNA-specific 2-thiouridylase
MPQKRVAIAMSGGEDSSVAAAILKKQGYQVFGVTMLLYSEDGTAEHAQRIASKLAIPHYVMDFSKLFRQQVITPFCTEYGQGRTPNPCITCNRYLKFDALLNKARELGADFMATGHYARVEPSPKGYRLLRGVDSSKDQSYFLYTLGQEQLRYLLLPIGYLSKAEVSTLAEKLGLSEVTKNESQDICFIPNSDYHSFIKEHISSQPGDITDTNGKVLGRHKGLAYYTVGQRKGLGLASNRRLYVIRLEAESNRLVVGSQDQLFNSRLLASQLSWVSGEAPKDSANITAKVRYKSPEVGVNLYINDDTAEVRFAQSQWAIAPGQSIVFYQGEVVLGGGVIEASGLMERNEPDRDSRQTILC